ncbi:hypothetical protein, partial [Pseudomonas aeruginosa]|uniref:hypothetical protein n=1 Tax=Pseudomonas aeruginosa TaxID=287 RepID=UPI001C130A47
PSWPVVRIEKRMRFGVLGEAEPTSCRGFVVQPPPARPSWPVVRIEKPMRFGVLGEAELTSCRGLVVQPTPGPAILAGRSH